MRRTRSRHVGRSVLSGATTPNRNGLVIAWNPRTRADIRPVTRGEPAYDRSQTGSDAAAAPKSSMNAVDATRIRTSPGQGQALDILIAQEVGVAVLVESHFRDRYGDH